jgi:hypothetical protein
MTIGVLLQWPRILNKKEDYDYFRNVLKTEKSLDWEWFYPPKENGGWDKPSILVKSITTIQGNGWHTFSAARHSGNAEGLR